MIKSSITTLACGILVMLAGSSWASGEGIKLPDIGDSSRAIVSEQDENAYKEALIREFRRTARVIEDPLVAGYLRHLGYSLVAHSEDSDREFSFFVVDSSVVNAFAAPGGFIGIHSELILTADNESELAGVMAHEVAHVTQKHLARAIESAQKISIPMMLLMVGAAIASRGDAQALQTVMVGGQAIQQQLQINFTRSNEHEADRVGIQTLARAGYDPYGMAGFFQKMSRIARNYGQGPPEFLRTHPVESTRIAEAKNRAAQIRVDDPPQRDPESFLLIKERLRVLTTESPTELLEYYSKQIEIGKAGVAESYGLSLAYLANQDPVGAFEALAPFADSHADSLPIQLTLAQIEFIAGHAEDSGRGFKALLDRFPGNRAVASTYAEALLESGGAKQAGTAEAILKPLLARSPNDSELFQLYSRAADQAGFEVRAKEAFAHHIFLLGRVYDAVSQLRELLKSPELDYYQRSRVEARLAELQPILARIERQHGWDPSEGKTEGDSRGRLAERRH